MEDWALSRRLRVGSFACVPPLLTLLLIIVPCAVRAESRIVSAKGEHLLGQHDTKEDAIRLATEAAKRDALEQVATYVESVTVSTDLDLSHDEIRIYTAGVVKVIDEQLTIAAEGGTVRFHIDLTAQIDTAEVAEAVKKLREHEEVRQELAALKSEIDQLHQNLEEANHALLAGLPADKAKDLAGRRTQLLNHMQSDELVQQAWIEWIIGGMYGWPSGYAYPQAVTVPMLLAWADRLHPSNPHVPVVTQVVTTRTGAPLPPASPHPPAPPGNTGGIPSYQQLLPPLPVPANAVKGASTRSQGFRHLQSMSSPPHDLPHTSSSPSGVIRTVPGSNPQAGRAPGNIFPAPTQRLRQFLPPSSLAMPPSIRAVPPPSSTPLGQRFPSLSGTRSTQPLNPGDSKGASRLRQTHPGNLSRPAPSSSGNGHGAGSGGRGGHGGHR